MANKATHSGHCQACGRLQKLPNGRLSKHGYTVTHGFFSGTCPGSDRLPFEVSCDYVAETIARATSAIEVLEAEKAETLANTDATNVMDRVYFPSHRFGVKGSTRWVPVTLIATEKNYGTEDQPRVYWTFETEHDGKRERENFGYSQTWTPETALAEMNRRYAVKLAGDILRLDSYVAWQRQRVAEWAPAPLLPVSAKDKQGFAVEE